MKTRFFPNTVSKLIYVTDKMLFIEYFIRQYNGLRNIFLFVITGKFDENQSCYLLKQDSSQSAFKSSETTKHWLAAKPS